MFSFRISNYYTLHLIYCPCKHVSFSKNYSILLALVSQAPLCPLLDFNQTPILSGTLNYGVYDTIIYLFALPYTHTPSTNTTYRSIKKPIKTRNALFFEASLTCKKNQEGGGGGGGEVSV